MRHAVERELDDARTCNGIGRRHEHLARESSRALHRRIHVPGHVGGREYQHLVVGLLEAVELRQKFVDDLAARVRARLGARERKRVEFVEEHHAGLLRARLLEHQRKIAFALAEPRGEDLGDADGEERGVAFIGDGARQHGLAAPGGP